MLQDRKDSNIRVSKTLMVIFSFAAITGCTYSVERPFAYEEPETQQRSPRLASGTISSPTVSIPKTLTKPSAASQKIRMGSASRAEDFLCAHMSHYTLVLNASFDSTLNVFKHRAARMGADWLSISKHSEITAHNAAYNNQSIHVVAGSTIFDEYETLTKLEGDLYDCR